MANNPVDMFVGSKLKLARTMKGFSQTKLGNMTGITFQQIQKYEKGVNRVGSSRLYEFSNILSVPVGYFFEGYQDVNSKEGENLAFAEEGEAFQCEDINNKEVLKLIRAFNKLPDKEVRKSVISLVRSLSAGISGDSSDDE